MSRLEALICANHLIAPLGLEDFATELSDIEFLLSFYKIYVFVFIIGYAKAFNVEFSVSYPTPFADDKYVYFLRAQ